MLCAQETSLEIEEKSITFSEVILHIFNDALTILEFCTNDTP